MRGHTLQSGGIGGVGLVVDGFAAEGGNLGNEAIGSEIRRRAAGEDEARGVPRGQVFRQRGAKATSTADDPVNSALTKRRFSGGESSDGEGPDVAAAGAVGDVRGILGSKSSDRLIDIDDGHAQTGELLGQRAAEAGNRSGFGLDAVIVKDA